MIVSNCEMRIFANGEFEYHVSLFCGPPTTSKGFWSLEDDSIVLKSRPNNNINRAVELIESTSLEESFTISIISRGRNGETRIDPLAGNLDLILYSQNNKFKVRTDSLGFVEAMGLRFVDSIEVKEIYGFKNWTVRIKDEKTNNLSIILLYPEIIEEVISLYHDERTKRYFDSEKWFKYDDLLFDPENIDAYILKK